MAGNSFVQVPPDSTGKKVDCVSLSVGGVDVFRQRICIGDGSSTFETAVVLAGKLQVALAGFVDASGNSKNLIDSAASALRIIIAGLSAATLPVSGTVNVNGGVAISGTASVVVNGFMDSSGNQKNVVDSANSSLRVTIAALSAATLPVSGTVNVNGGVAISGTASVVVNGFLDPSGTQRNVVDSVNTSLRVTIAALSAATMPVSGTVNVNGGVAISGTASVVINGFLDPSGQQRNVVDSVNTALRVNVVAGGAGGGAVFGQVSAGASLSVTNVPVLMGGNDSVGGGIARTLLLDTSGRVLLGAAAQSVGIVTVGNFIDASGTVKNLVDSVPAALRVSLITASTTLVVSGTVNVNGGVAISGTASVVINGFLDPSGNQRNVVDSANTALRVTIAALSAATLPVSGTVNVNGGVAISGVPTVVIGGISAGVIFGVNLAAQSAGFIMAMQGAVAQNASVTAGNSPVLIGAVVKTSASTTATSGAATHLWADKNGRLVVVMNHPSLPPSASHGPKLATLSTSVGIALIAAPGVGNVIFIDNILVTNGGTSLTQFAAYEVSATATPVICGYAAANGGGWQRQYNPPLRISANTALNGRISVNTSKVVVDIQFHVGVD